jgi:alpha-tubulin suppressor-like RCC1 family protein
MLQSCGVADGGAAYCWGDDSFGQLGVPAESLTQRCDAQKLVCSTVPVQVSGGLRFAQISAGLGSHTCGVTTDGSIACWGLGVSGQRGDGTTTYVVSTPTIVPAP